MTFPGGFVSPVTGPGGPTSDVTPFDVNPGVRWQIGFGFFTVEDVSNPADYGVGIDDVVFEWDERHPVDEGAFVPPHVAACQRFGLQGQPAGQQCATLSVDRTNLYECSEALTVTVNDPKRAGAGNVVVLAASNSDSRPFSTGVVTALHPVKSFTLSEVGVNSGLFVGSVPVSQALNTPTTLFVTTGDQTIEFYYQDQFCDGNGNGVVAQNDFDNLDGDGVAFAADNCKFDYNPSQADSENKGEQAGLMRNGTLPRAREALLADAIGTVAGATLGTSTVTAFIESGAGIAAGGRTGLTSLVTAALFTLGQYLIGLYLGQSGVASAYGAAGSLVVVLVWVYYSAQIVLFGAEISHAYAQVCGSRSHTHNAADLVQTGRHAPAT